MTRRPATESAYRSPDRLVGWRRVAVAAVVCLALGGLLVLDRQLAEGGMLEFLAESALLPPDAPLEDIQRIVIENHVAELAPNRRIVLERAADGGGEGAAPGSGWRLTAPHALPAWPDMMHGFLANLSGARRRNEFEGAADAGNGLTSPTLTATFHWRGGADARALTFEFGDKSSFNGEIFARASDRPDHVFTVREQVWRRLAQNFTTYVDLRVFPMPRGAAVRFELENPSGRVEVALDPGDQRWWIAGEPRAPADREVLVVYLKDLANVRMARVLEDGDRRPLGEVVARVRLTTDAGDATELRVGDRITTPQGNLWLAERDDFPNMFLLDATTVEAFMFPAVFFRHRDLFDFDPAQVVAFRILYAGGTLQLRRDTPDRPWQLAGRSRRPLRQAFLDGVVQDFARLRSRGFLRRDDERQALLFTSDDILVEADIRVGDLELRTARLRLSRRPPDAKDQLIYALADDGEFFCALPMTVLQRFWLRLEHVLEPRLAQGRLGDIAAIRLVKTDADGRPPADILLERRDHPDRGAAWHVTMAQPVERSGWVDPGVAGEVLGQLDALAFSRLMASAEQEQAEEAAGQPLFLLRLELGGGEVLESAAVFGAADPKGDVAARLADGSSVRLPLESIVSFHRLLLEKVMPYLDAP